MKANKNYLLLSIVLCCFMACTAKNNQPKNIIFLIGDGMGIAQVTAAMTVNGNKLNMERCTYFGFSKTYSFSNYITDSAAGGTALACGVKTRNAMIGMGPDSVGVESILESCGRNGLATGVVVTCEVTHATPASFVAHQINRNMDQEIAADFVKNPYLNLFIGGGRRHFENRADGRNLIKELEEKGFTIASNTAECMAVKDGKLAGFLFEEGWDESSNGGHLPAMPMRGSVHADATMAAIDILDNNKDGFFLMVEGSQIDWGGHANDTEYIVNETLDFDYVVGKVLDYAEKNKNTLVVITADHETSGMGLNGGSMQEGTVNANYTTKNHTGVMVPIYAYGPGAEEFSGIMENTELRQKMARLLKLK